MYPSRVKLINICLSIVILSTHCTSRQVRGKRELGLSLDLGNILGGSSKSSKTTTPRSSQTSSIVSDLAILDLSANIHTNFPNEREKVVTHDRIAVEEEDDGRGPPSHAGPPNGNGPPGLNGKKPPGHSKNDKNQSSRCKNGEIICDNGECMTPTRCEEIYGERDNKNREGSSGDSSGGGGGGCVLPEQPAGGNYELGGCNGACNKYPGDKVPRNSILTYNCKRGYNLNGNTITVCVNDSWYMPPSCQKTCPPLNSTSVNIQCIYKGEIVSCSEKILPGTRAKLSCKHSYKLSLTNDPGYRELTCQEEGLWDHTIFRCLPECGTAIAHGNTLVVNGFDAKVGVFPWHVGIYDKKIDYENSKPEQICAGTLISNDIVVSAAHCFYDESTGQARSASNFAVGAGKHYRHWDHQENYVQKSNVNEIILANRYIGARGNFAQDIAVMKLDKPFELTTFVKPVCLDWENSHEREQLENGKSGKVVGWGKTIQGEPSDNLQEINLPFVPYDQCLNTVPEDFRGYITSDKFCAGYKNASSLCEGDSGGGLCFQMNNVWYLRGIVSVSPVKDGSCDYNSYVGFTYVSHFRDWIRAIYIKT